MARPQAEEGFVMIALDLFVALMTCDIPNRDAVVLAEILTQSYGPSKRRNVPIDPASLEDITGLHRNNVRAALRSLADAHVIAKNNDGTYRFLKDWEAWRPGGKPFVERLGGGLAMFARSVKARFGTIRASKKDPIQGDIASTPSAIQLDSGEAPDLNSTGLTLTPLPQSDWIVPVAYGKAEIADATYLAPEANGAGLAGARTHAELDFRIKTLELPPLPPNPGGGAGASESNGDAGPVRGGDPAGAPPAPRVVNTPAAVTKALARVEELFPLNSFMFQAQQALRDYPAAWVVEAVEIAHGKGNDRWLFMGGILKRFSEQGQSDAEKHRKTVRAAPPEKPAARLFNPAEQAPDALAAYRAKSMKGVAP